MSRFVPSTRRRGDGRMKVILRTIEIMLTTEILSLSHESALRWFHLQLRKRLSQ